MKKDDARFIAALCVTLLLAVSVVAFVHHRNVEETVAATAVDVSSLEELAEEGVISLHPADHWESLEKTERVSADIPLIERKSRQGKLSLHQADHWEEVPGR